LVYFAPNDKGEKVSNPFKASLFGKDAEITQLQKHFEQSKEKMKTNPAAGKRNKNCGQRCDEKEEKIRNFHFFESPEIADFFLFL